MDQDDMKDVCSICIENFAEKSYLENCLHPFCFKCILAWSMKNSECPVCRRLFKGIIHNIRSVSSYDVYDLDLQTIRPLEESSSSLPNEVILSILDREAETYPVVDINNDIVEYNAAEVNNVGGNIQEEESPFIEEIPLIQEESPFIEEESPFTEEETNTISRYLTELISNDTSETGPLLTDDEIAIYCSQFTEPELPPERAASDLTDAEIAEIYNNIGVTEEINASNPLENQMLSIATSTENPTIDHSDQVIPSNPGCSGNTERGISPVFTENEKHAFSQFIMEDIARAPRDSTIYLTDDQIDMISSQLAAAPDNLMENLHLSDEELAFIAQSSDDRQSPVDQINNIDTISLSASTENKTVIENDSNATANLLATSRLETESPKNEDIASDTAKNNEEQIPISTINSENRVDDDRILNDSIICDVETKDILINVSDIEIAANNLTLSEQDILSNNTNLEPNS